MRLLRLVDEYRALSQESAALANEVASSEQVARQDLASSASRFTRRSQEVLDDKLNFSATLARAGEHEAAKRLLAEFADDVAAEELALVERVNEVRVAQAVTKDRLTRARLLKTVIAAMIGTSLMLVGAMGLAVASMFEDDGEVIITTPHRKSLTTAAAATDTKVVRVAGVSLRLTPRERAVLQNLTDGQINEARLQDFLLSVVGSPTLAEQLTQALTDVPDAIEPVTDTLAAVVDEAQSEAEDTGEAQEAEANQNDPNDDRTQDRSNNNGSGEDPGEGSGGEMGGGLPDPDDLVPID